MANTDFSSALVDREVERLFKENPPVYGELCRNPVTFGSYVGGLDPIKLQKEDARRALLAREWFVFNGPADAQPLPVSSWERDKIHLREDYARFLFHHVLALYSRSLEAHNFNFIEHPSFADYVSGVLWEAELPVGGFAGLPNVPDELRELKKRFPPRMLKGMGPGLCWLPPKQHAEAIASLRRSSHNAEVYFNRE